MITLLLQTSLLLAVVLLFYSFVLEKETHHRLNRLVLFTCMILICVLPQIDIQVPVPDFWPNNMEEITALPLIPSDYVPEELPLENDVISFTSEIEQKEAALSPLETSSTYTPPTINFSWNDITLFTYLLGLVVMLIHLFTQLLSIYVLIRRSTTRKEGKYTLVAIEEGKASYSFFNYIFISPKAFDASTYQQILSHEKIHADQKHSVDILFSQILVILLWFNPLAWLYKKKVKENLEYLTDELMVQKGNDKQLYQFSLLHASTPHQHPKLVLNYSQSLLKKRILMMNSKKSSLSTTWKYVFLLPILGFSVLLFAAKEMPKQEEMPVQEIVPQQVFEPFVQVENPEPINESEQVFQTQDQQQGVPVQAQLFSSSEIDGTWEAMAKEGEICLRLTRSLSENEWNWMNHDCYERNVFSPSNIEDQNSFEFKETAGTIRFTGQFRGKKGEGTFTFEGSESYTKTLQRKGVLQVSEELLWRLFFIKEHDKYIDNLIAIQDLGIRGETLDKLSASLVKADLVKDYQEAGLSVEDHVSFIMSRVGPKLLKDYRDAGFDLEEQRGFINSRVQPSLLSAYQDANLDLEEHRTFINSRVKPELLTSYQAAGFDLDEHRSFINSRVNPDFLKKYENAGLALDKHRGFINSRVSPELLQSYNEAGFDLEEYRSFINSRVKPSFLKEYKNAGFALDEYRSFINSRVPPKLLQSYKKEGLDLEEHHSFINSRVSPEFLKEYLDAGLSLGEHRSFINSRVHPDFLKKYKAAGFDLDEYRSFINSRVSPEFLQAYKAAGFSLDEHRSFINSRVDPKFLQEYEKAGYPIKEHQEFINHRISPSFLKKYEDAGLAIDEHKEFILDRVNPETLRKYRDAQKDSGRK